MIILFQGNTKSLNKEDVAACIPHLFAALEDRAPEVRKAAQDATLAFMIHLGYESLARQAGKLKPASKTLVLAHLDKVRPNLPAKPAPAPAAAPAAPAVVKPKMIPQPSKESPKEEEEAPPKSAPPSKVLRVPSKTKVRFTLTFRNQMFQSYFVGRLEAQLVDLQAQKATAKRRKT